MKKNIPKVLGVIIFTFAASFISAQPKPFEAITVESAITYKLIHPLHEIEATSKDASYHVEIDPSKKEIKKVTAEVDVTSFNSGNSNRDSHAMEVIDALEYPDVTFASLSITQKGDSVTVYGKLTFHGVTKDISIPVISTWTQGKLEITGGFDVTLTGFNIERPSLLMIPVEDKLSFIISAVFNLQ